VSTFLLFERNYFDKPPFVKQNLQAQKARKVDLQAGGKSSFFYFFVFKRFAKTSSDEFVSI